MIFLAFLLPLAIYLLVLGFLNRGRHPLLVSGVWDGIGLLFGVSGFLLFAGPAVLSTLSERWRLFWLFGPVVSLAGADGAWPLWSFLALLYFLVIVGGAALYLQRQRRLTAIYNSNADLVERTLFDICKKMGLDPVCSGGLFVFGLSSANRVLPTAICQKEDVESGQRAADGGQAILEVESFPLLHHVTLRWEPAASPLRRVVEGELSRRLSETLSDDSLLGGWLLTLGFLLLSFDLVCVFILVLLNLHLLAR